MRWSRIFDGDRPQSIDADLRGRLWASWPAIRFAPPPTWASRWSASPLLHRRGYFYQRLDRAGWQTEEPVAWAINDFAEPLEPRVSVEIEGRSVQVRAWRHIVTGMSGMPFPYICSIRICRKIVPGTGPSRIRCTGRCHYRLCQELVLGFGGFALLQALGHDPSIGTISTKGMRHCWCWR